MNNITCSDCGNELSSETNSPCRNCGSTNRNIHLFDHGVGEEHMKLKVKEFDQNRKNSRHKAIRETTVGEDYQRKTETWLNIHMVVDRILNLYKKTLTNPGTGEIVRDVQEPLSEHKGYGAAKNFDLDKE